jgi:hypothetical protein
VTVGDPGFERDWARCLYILHHYEDQITSATQAIQVLQVMKDSVSGNGFPTHRKFPDHTCNLGRSVRSHILIATPVQQHMRSQYPNHSMLPPQPQPMPPIATTTAIDYSTMPNDLQGVNPFMPGMDSMSEAWFGQQLLNMDWLDPNMPLQHSS